MGQIHALLAERGYEVSETAPDTIRIREVDSGIAIQAVLEGSILFFSLVCTVVPKAAITADVMAQMLSAENGISTSGFQLYDAGEVNEGAAFIFHGSAAGIGEIEEVANALSHRWDQHRSARLRSGARYTRRYAIHR